jgi:hypothetical protein
MAKMTNRYVEIQDTDGSTIKKPLIHLRRMVEEFDIYLGALKSREHKCGGRVYQVKLSSYYPHYTECFKCGAYKMDGWVGVL